MPTESLAPIVAFGSTKVAFLVELEDGKGDRPAGYVRARTPLALRS